MLQTLFYIPHEIFGVPTFGFGWALGAWVLFAIGFLAWEIRRAGWTKETQGHLPMLLLVAAAIYAVLPNLEQRLVDGTPIGLPIRGYGLMLLLGVVSGVALAYRRARQVGVDPEIILSLAFWVFLFGIIGARAFYVIEYRQNFLKPTVQETVIEILKFTEGGLVVYGSFFGAMAAIWLYTRKRKIPLLPIADIVAPSLMIGVALGRIGCLFNGCCHGGPSNLHWLEISFPRNAPPYLHQLENGELLGLKIRREDGTRFVDSVRPDGLAAERGIQAGDELLAYGVNTLAFTRALQLDPDLDEPVVTLETPAGRQTWTFAQLPDSSRPVQPTQIYSAIDGLLLCLFLTAYFPYRRRDGEVFAWLITIYPITRFLIEIIRTDEPGQFGSSFSISQWVSILLLAFVAGFWFYLITARPPLAGESNAAQGSNA